MRTSYITFLTCLAAIASANAAPIEYNDGYFSARVSGYGNVGIIEPNFALNNVAFLGDWSVRGQMTYAADETHKLGMVYSLNQQTVDEKGYINDLFALWQVKGLGRLEIGLTDSVTEN